MLFLREKIVPWSHVICIILILNVRFSENNLEISQPKIMKIKEKGNLAFLMYQEVLFYNFILVSDNIEKKPLTSWTLLTLTQVSKPVSMKPCMMMMRLVEWLKAAPSRLQGEDTDRMRSCYYWDCTASLRKLSARDPTDNYQLIKASVC